MIQRHIEKEQSMKDLLAVFLLTFVTSLPMGFLHAQSSPIYRNAAAEVEKRIDDLLARMTLEEKIDMIGGHEEFFILPNDRLGIPAIKMADGPLGVRNYGEATAFPAGIAIAASWNVDLMRSVATAVGKEARSKGVHIMLAPGLNIYRTPMCGRNFEYFGEDPYLASRMAVAYVKGVQSQGVVTTAKHFAANNQEYDRNNVSSDVDERALQEIYLPAFRAAVTEGGSGAVMTSYNLINGVHASQNEHLIRDILKGQWKFDGFVMSDWGSTYDGVAAANAGLDLEMPSGEFMNRATLIPAVKSGKVKESVIDDKTRRMLRVMFRMGFFDRPQMDTSLPVYNPDSRLVALQAAREGCVLLKNAHGTLPLDRSLITSIAVVGPGAHPAITGGGGSSRVEPFRSVSILDGMIQLAGNAVRVYYHEGLKRDEEVMIRTAVFSTGNEQGLRGEYFRNMSLEGAPEFSRIDKQIDFNWERSPADNFPREMFSVRWTGTIRVGQSGAYDFIVRGDDGFRLFIDDRVIIDEWRDQATMTATASKYLQANEVHRVRLEYYQNRGGAVVAFGWGKSKRTLQPDAITLARKTDAAVVCVGFNDRTEGEGFDRPFALTAEENELIKSVAAVNSRTIVVLTAGGNVEMTDWIDSIGALLHVWYPGQEGGIAVAEILFGDVNPSGKLPASFEKRWEDNACFKSYYDDDNDKRVSYSEGIFVGYRHFDKEGIEPMFPFGHGLSYTTFEYSNLVLSTSRLRLGETLEVKFDVRNTGTRGGAEVAQVYVREVKPVEVRPVKELKGFVKTSLQPGETKHVSVILDGRAFSYFSSVKNAWVTEPGAFEVIVGSSSRILRFTSGVVVTGTR
jgi:beta-glucosidase